MSKTKKVIKNKPTFPMLGVKNWFLLRKAFKEFVPEQVDMDYLAGKLGMSRRSAANNVFPYLKTIGFLDGEGKPTNLAMNWIDDREYPNVCKNISDAIYPQKLRRDINKPEENKSKVKKWFEENGNVGAGAAGRMSAFYTMLSAADLGRQSTKKHVPRKSRKSFVKDPDKTKAALKDEKSLEAIRKPKAVPWKMEKFAAATVKEELKKPVSKKAPVSDVKVDASAIREELKKPSPKKTPFEERKPPKKIVAPKKVPARKKSTKTETNARGHQKTQPVALNIHDIPDMTFNIQLILTKDTTPAQIDQVFLSLAKHLKK